MQVLLFTFYFNYKNFYLRSKSHEKQRTKFSHYYFMFEDLEGREFFFRTLSPVCLLEMGFLLKTSHYPMGCFFYRLSQSEVFICKRSWIN